MKLEEVIHHYLGTEVECSYIPVFGDGKRIKAILTGIGADGIETTYKRKKKGCSGDLIGFTGHNNINDMEFKLHLHPMSRLTEGIEHDGKKFIPIERMLAETIYDGKEVSYAWNSGVLKIWDVMSGDLTLMEIDPKNIDALDYFIVQMFIKMHFNVFDIPEDQYIIKPNQ